MKQFYMDTNVFISRLKPDDPFFAEAKKIAKAIEKGEVRAETSVLTLLEVASVSGRVFSARKEKHEQEDRQRKVFIVRALKRLARTKTKLINMAGDTPISIRGIDAVLPSIFDEAILLSLRTNLRSLDLIHLAAARNGKRTNGELGAFVTGDHAFLSNKKEIAETIGMPVLSPKEYVEGLGL